MCECREKDFITLSLSKCAIAGDSIEQSQRQIAVDFRFQLDLNVQVELEP